MFTRIVRAHPSRAGAWNGIESGAMGGNDQELENDPGFWEHQRSGFSSTTRKIIAYSGMLCETLDKSGGRSRSRGKDRTQGNGRDRTQPGRVAYKDDRHRYGTNLWPLSVPPEQLTVNAETRELVVRALIFKPLPFVKSVVFIATPHGVATRRSDFRPAGVMVVNLPGRFVKFNVELMTLQTKGLSLGTLAASPPALTI